MTEISSLPDAQTRRLAVTTFDRNVVVVAGAGTGKTTLLVNRFIHTLMRETYPPTITQIVALTFTNKAASEMKSRLREQLVTLAKCDQGSTTEPIAEAVSVDELREHTQLSQAQISERAVEALRDFDKAQIGTVHSFAAHLLRLNPIESGVDPLFQEDDGSQFEHQFNQEWEFWLDCELGSQGSEHLRWRRILADLGLAEIRLVALALCNENIDLRDLRGQVDRKMLPPSIKDWLERQSSRVTALLSQYESGRKRKIESSLGRAQEVFEVLLNQGLESLTGIKERVNQGLAGHYGKLPNGWDEKDFREARRIVSLAKALVSVDQGKISELFDLLEPFIRKVRQRFIDEGYMTFDGLLARANALLRYHPSVREHLKKEYKALLVDEFQDTDPVQYEIILYLAERVGSWSAGWKDVDLAAGKLFIVGDPKQSIYAFRRADLEAYDQVVQKVRDSGGVVLELSTNFRSHPRVLDVVNAVFGRVLQPIPNVQPANVQLLTQPGRVGEVTHPGVELHVVTKSSDAEEGLDSESATRLEAERLARWIKEELLANSMLIDSDGRGTPLQPGHIGLLMRKLTQAQDYLDALRRYGIPYVTDGEKHFYRRQEVVDFINLLRAIENSSDTIAIIGVLRSPLGALTDQEVYELCVLEGLDYRRPERLEAWNSPRTEGVQRLYGALRDLKVAAPTLSLPTLMDAVFSRIPVLELAAASLHGEHAVANLLKFRELAEQAADWSHLSLNGFIDVLIDRLAEQHDESEGGGVEESLDAIRVLTVHKAKGLEFPVVILPGLHHGTNINSGGSLISHDWATGTMGISVGQRHTFGAALIREKLQMKEEAEQRRLFYVGMTRVKERLILSCGIPDRPSRGSFLAILQEVADIEIGSVRNTDIRIGNCLLPLTVHCHNEQAPEKKPKWHPSKLKLPLDIDKRWAGWIRRERRWRKDVSEKQFLTPTFLINSEKQNDHVVSTESQATPQGNVIGTLAHRILEAWDFHDDFGQIYGIIARLRQNDLSQDLGQHIADLQGELLEIFQVFYGSEPYRKLQRARVIGREIPFVIPWYCSEDPNQDIKNRSNVLEGVIDLVYKIDGHLWVADYKTERLEDVSRSHRGTTYEQQGRIYRDAARRSLGLNQVGCEILFVRHGISIEL